MGRDSSRPRGEAWSAAIAQSRGLDVSLKACSYKDRLWPVDKYWWLVRVFLT